MIMLKPLEEIMNWQYLIDNNANVRYYYLQLSTSLRDQVYAGIFQIKEGALSWADMQEEYKQLFRIFKSKVRRV